MYNNVTVVIPSYKPDEKLLSTLQGVMNAGFKDVIVVDDGGGETYAKYFEIAKEYGCTVLHHEVNRGKGAALKTAFKYYSENRPDSKGLITADADGQHLPCEISSVADTMLKTESVVLGSRDFSQPNVPPRSKMGNRITSGVFKLFLGMKIGDTQTGLRGIPRRYVDVLATADGDRYEYETHALFLMKQEHIPYTECKISTVYIDGNSSSHFRIIHDSMRIYSLLLKFMLSSLISTVADAILFCILFGVFESAVPGIGAILLASLVSRLCSSILNYAVNLNAVFKCKFSAGNLIKYGLIAIPYAIISSAASCLAGVFVESISLALIVRLLVGFVLFALSFRLQHNRVFTRKYKR